jgi:hypothetical protein
MANNKNRPLLSKMLFFRSVTSIDVTKLPREQKVAERAVNYSSGLRNSNPKIRRSPARDWRRIFAEIGGVSFGTTLEEDVGEGAGTVMLTTWSGRRK